MGIGIAQVAASSGCDVFLYDANSAQTEKSLEGLQKILARLVEKNKIDFDESENIYNKIQFCTELKDFKDCDVIIITAGIARKPGMSRNDLLLTNAKIMTSVIDNIIPYNQNSIIIIVSNPLDVMVYTALKASNWSRNKIIGMAGILDSARMAHFIFEKLGYGQGQIDASVMGGHGDDMVPLADFSTVAGVNLSELLSKNDIEDIINKTKNGGAQIVKLLETGSAYYAPAYSTILMIEAILEDKKEIYPCAVMLEGEYGYKNIVSGVPIMIGANGVEKIIELNLKDEQKNQFAKSIASVQELINILKEEK